MLESLSFGAVAAVCFCVALLLMWQKAWPKVRDWLMLIAGFGVAGLFGGLLDQLAGILTNAAGIGTEAMFGAGVALVIGVLMAIFLFLRMRPKGAGPSKKSWVVALLFPSVLAALGLNLLPMITDVFTAISDTASQMASQVNSGM